MRWWRLTCRTRNVIRLMVLGLSVCCGPIWAQRTYAIVGTIVSAGGVIENGTMVVVDGRIQDVGTNPTVPKDATIIRVDGVVFPGLIDLHNHLTWNVLPRWRLPSPVANRYEWQAMPEYAARLSGPEGALMAQGSGCDMERYAEVKALLGGATSVVGGYRNECAKGLARNLDVFSGLYSDQINKEPVRYEIFPMEIGWEQAKVIRDSLGNGSLKAVIFHVGEGKDASAKREFRMFNARGFLRAGVSIIHGVAFGESEFRQMAANGVGFIWSPKSNLELYGKTADIEAAKASKVTMALAPDWSPTGSSGMLDELRVAVGWNRDHAAGLSDSEMVQMVTSNPARLGAAGDKIGAIAPGMMADFVVLPKVDGPALKSLLEARPGSVELVVVGGKALMGTAEYMQKFADVKIDLVTACGYDKALNVRDDIGGESWTTLETRLKRALLSVGSSLAELSECRMN